MTTMAEHCARAAHEVNNVYNRAIGDTPSPEWDQLTDAQRMGAVAGAQHAIDGGTPETSHELWLATRHAEGWKYGPVKDPEKKEHPCFVPFSELPTEQQAKDYIFTAIVHALKDR